MISCSDELKPSKNKYPCKKNTELYYEYGLLKQCELNQEINIKNIIFPKNTIIRFDENENLVSIKINQDFTIQDNTFPEKSLLTFYKNLNVENCYLSKSCKIDGIHCNKGSISFFNTGRLKSFQCLTEYRNIDITFPEMSIINRNQDLNISVVKIKKT